MSLLDPLLTCALNCASRDCFSSVEIGLCALSELSVCDVPAGVTVSSLELVSVDVDAASACVNQDVIPNSCNTER